jgi:hypothetical protein
MNPTPNNNSNPLTADEISKLHGEELKQALAQKLQGYKDGMAEVDNSLKDICEEVEAMPEVDEAKTKKEDDATIAGIEKQLDDDLNNAALELATEDEILSDIPAEE